MRRVIRGMVPAIVGVLVVSLAPSAQAAAAKVRLVSVTSQGAPADGSSVDPSVTADGRFVVFAAESSNLPGGNGIDQIYVHDRKTKETRLVSKTSSGVPADGDSFEPSISDDGRFVVFYTEASNLPGGGAALSLVYVHDRKTGKTRLVSKTSAGVPADSFSFNAEISADGRFVAFESNALNLPGGGLGFDLVYVHDRKTKKTRLVSKTSSGVPADNDSSDPTLSADGRFVAFESFATNLPGGAVHDQHMVYVHDRKTKKTRLVSKSSAGAPANEGSDEGVISADGRFVAFESSATNLPGGAVHSSDQIYVHDLKSKKTRLVSKSSAGAPTDSDNDDPSISPEGRFVAFESAAANLPGGPAPDDQVYIHDRKSGKTRLASKAPSGEPANGSTNVPSASRCVTAGGRFVVFSTFADNLPGSGPPADELVYIYGRMRWPK